MKKYKNFYSKVWALFYYVLSAVLSIFAAAVIVMIMAYCGAAPTQTVFIVLAVIVFAVRLFPQPRGSLQANFVFGTTSFGTMGDTENPGGLQGKLLWCPLCDITAHPALPAANGSSTNAQAVTLTGTYTMVATKVFVPLYGIDDKFKYSAKKIAEKGGAGFEQMLEATFTGQSDDLLAFIRRVASQPGVLYCITPEGTQYNVGTEAYPAWAEVAEYTTGAGMKELRNATVTFKASSLAPVCKFAGTVPIS